MKPTGLLLILSVLLLTLFSCGEEKTQPVSDKQPVNDSILSVPPSKKPVNPYAGIDVSPMDMSYFPAEYPKLKMANHNAPPPVARVIYSRPHLAGRHLFDQVLKYGEPWRLGANEATEIQFYRDVTIQKKKVRSGRYILYCIPQPDKWMIILNSNLDSWGLEQDPAKDIQRFEIAPGHDHGGPSLEDFTMVFEKTDIGADLVIAWGDILARLPINF
ncbi:MAG: DUF2911 domain-containing protein [Chitinophagaceae bacterium]|nr:DUF2911 domain-containing protein [Chitinophagaceae bacterium]